MSQIPQVSSRSACFGQVKHTKMNVETLGDREEDLLIHSTRKLLCIVLDIHKTQNTKVFSLLNSLSQFVRCKKKKNKIGCHVPEQFVWIKFENINKPSSNFTILPSKGPFQLH